MNGGGRSYVHNIVVSIKGDTPFQAEDEHVHFELTSTTYHPSIGLGSALRHLGRRTKDVQTSSSLDHSKCSAIQYKYNQTYITQSSLQKGQWSPASVSFLKIHSALGALSTSITRLSDNLSKPQSLQVHSLDQSDTARRVLPGLAYGVWTACQMPCLLS